MWQKKQVVGIVDATQLQQLDKDLLIMLMLKQSEQIELLRAEVQKLKDQLAKNSQNSSKPPSSDGLKKPAKSLREKGKHKSGGQKGHQGKTLEMVANAHHVQVHELKNCPECQRDLSAVPVKGLEKRQVFDVPPIELEVTEHQAKIKCCPHCQRHVKACFPEGVNHAVQYGQRLKAQAVYLNAYQLLPLVRSCELFGDWYGHVPSEAFVLKAMHEIHARL